METFSAASRRKKYDDILNFDPEGLLGRERYLEVLFIRTSHYIERALKKELLRMNIPPKIGAIIPELYWRNNLSPIELSSISDRKPQTTTAIIDRMEKSGLIKKIVNENKKNTYKICLTEKGLLVYQKIASVDVFTRIARQLPQETRQQLQVCLEELATQAKKIIG